MKRLAVRAALFAVSLALAACFGSVHTPPVGPARPPRLFEDGWISATSRDLELVRLTPRRNSTRRLFEVSDFSMPSAGDNGQPGNRVEARYFRSTKLGQKGLVIVLPIWGYPQYISRILAKRLRAGETAAGDIKALLL